MKPPIHDIQRLETELESLQRQIEQIQEAMVKQLFLSTAGGNRRQLIGGEGWRERRQGERRPPERATPGRRQCDDRRIPIENRWPQLGSQLSHLVAQSAALQQEKQRLQILF